MNREREVRAAQQNRARSNLLKAGDVKGALAHRPGPFEGGRPSHQCRIRSGVRPETGTKIWVIW